MSGYFERMKLIKLELLPKEAVAKERKPLAKKSAKKILEEKELKDAGTKPPSKLELDKWFYEIEKKCMQDGPQTFCMECYSFIPNSFIRHATAHLLPKKLFKSVATHPLNYLILGAGCGCHYKTDRIDKFIQMKVWPEAARRIKIMLPLLPFDELKFLSSQLLTALDNTPDIPQKLPV